MKDVTVYFPKFTRKAISFTIDDGNVKLDTKFINIVRPAGILGTFNPTVRNLNGSGYSHEELRELYSGYEIANHSADHPLAMDPDVEYEIVEKDAEIIPGTNRIHKTDRPDIYLIYLQGKDRLKQLRIVNRETYIEQINRGKEGLEEIFGKGSVKGFVWPYHAPKDEKLHEYLRSAGYESVRRTGNAGFELPRDRTSWCYNAYHLNMTELAEKFEALPDDGELRWFCFGIHSHDFENANCWNVLEDFAKRYGNRPQDFFYATVHDIFAYEDAAKSLVRCGNEITNPSEIDIYITADGKRTVVHAGETVFI